MKSKEKSMMNFCECEKIVSTKNQKKTIQINEKVYVEKRIIDRIPCYSILIPGLAQEVHLKPETTVKVIEALKLLLCNNEFEEEIERNGCQIIDFNSYRMK